MRLTESFVGLLKEIALRLFITSVALLLRCAQGEIDSSLSKSGYNRLQSASCCLTANRFLLRCIKRLYVHVVSMQKNNASKFMSFWP